MFEILGNIYDRSIAIVFRTEFFGTSWRLCKIVFWRKTFQNLIFVFSSYPKLSRAGSKKISITHDWLVVKSCPTPHWVTFLTFCRLVYDTPSHLNGLILAWSTSLRLYQKVRHQNSKLVYEIFPFLKQAVSVIHFTGMLIVIELLI